MVQEVLEESGLRDECVVGADGVLPTSFLDGAILCGLDHEAFHDDGWSWEDPVHEPRTLDALAAGVRTQADALPTSLAEDGALLAGSTLQDFDRAIVAYRHAFKALLASAADGMERQAAELRAGTREPQAVVPDADESGVYEMVSVDLPWPPEA